MNPPDVPIRLGSAARATRLAATVAVLVALLAGTFWGNDEHFPFGPFRMYSIANRTNGTVTESVLWGTTQSGERIELGFDSFGLRRAEIEGQIPRIEEDPTLLQHVATAYEDITSNGTTLEEVRLVEIVHHLRGGREVRSESEVVAVWRRE